MTQLNSIKMGGLHHTSEFRMAKQISELSVVVT
jgi:hypothetical protein